MSYLSLIELKFISNILIKILFWFMGLSWLWSYSSWIHNYLCNQCLSPIKLWVWILLRWGILDTTLCDKVCQWRTTGHWFSPDTPVSSTNKTNRHDMAEILLKVALNSTIFTLPLLWFSWFYDGEWSFW